MLSALIDAEFFSGRTVLLLSNDLSGSDSFVDRVPCLCDRPAILEDLPEVWPYKEYYDVIILDNVGNEFNDFIIKNSANRCKWFYTYAEHKELVPYFSLSHKTAGLPLYEHLRNTTVENIKPLTGKYRKLESSYLNNQEYLDRVGPDVYKTGVPVDRYWTFELIENIKDLIDFDSIKTVLDIGSRDCYQSLEFNTWFPNAEIYAFEANRNSAINCREVSKECSRITVVEKAVSTYNGTTSFYEVPPGGNTGASCMLKNSEHPRSTSWVGNKVTVPCITLDTFMTQSPTKTADILWMDVQGAELHVLQGATDTLKNVKVIATEVCVSDLYVNGTLKSDLDCFLRHHGFVCIATYCHGTNTDLNFLRNDSGEIDAIYVKEEYIK